jgi:hypothetical protein
MANTIPLEQVAEVLSLKTAGLGTVVQSVLVAELLLTF